MSANLTPSANRALGHFVNDAPFDPRTIEELMGLAGGMGHMPK